VSRAAIREPGAARAKEAAWVEAYLRQCLPRLLAGQPVMRTIEPLDEDVWRVEILDGRALVAKHQPLGFLVRGTACDLLRVEEKVLDILGREKCPVPRWLGSDPETQFIFLECAGDHTLDDVAQEGPPATCRTWVRQAIEGLCAIDRAFEKHRAVLEPGVSPAADRPALQRAWDQAGAMAQEGREQVLGLLGRPVSCGREVLEEMHACLAGRPAALGSTDYNARNLVIDPSSGRLRFLEFAKIGWDWTERRLVQYTTSMGTRRVDGCLRPLLDAQDAAFYVQCAGREDGARTLEYHQIFFLLNGAAQPPARLGQFAASLAAPLSADPLAQEFRSIFHCPPRL
jgi:hypothetical protein